MSSGAKLKSLALIREAECIGCTKCIQACPVDAILGSSRHMHTVIADECIGCNLCVPPCPVDCIEMLPSEKEVLPVEERKHQAAHIKGRYVARQQRLEKRQAVALEVSALEAKRAYILEAIGRAKKERERDQKSSISVKKLV